MIRRPPRSTQGVSSAASDVYKRQMRTEKYMVRKPVTEKMIEVTKKTTYKPVVKSKTTMVPTQVPVIQLGSTPDPNARPRAQWLERGYYTDPATGQSVFRKRGLHWVQPHIGAASVGVVPALIPQEKMEVSYEPETTEERTPIEVTRYVDCLLYTSPSPRDQRGSRMPSSA